MYVYRKKKLVHVTHLPPAGPDNRYILTAYPSSPDSTNFQQGISLPLTYRERPDEMVQEMRAADVFAGFSLVRTARSPSEQGGMSPSDPRQCY